MIEKKCKYTQEFKAEAIKLVLEQHYSQAEAARSLGISAKNVSRWIKETDNRNNRLSRKRKELTADQKEMERLRKENKRLKLERDILKRGLQRFKH